MIMLPGQETASPDLTASIIHYSNHLLKGKNSTALTSTTAKGELVQLDL